MDARKYLKQVSKIDKIIKNKMIEKEQWESIATGITGLANMERVQMTMNCSKMENAVIKTIGIDHDIEKLKSKRQQIIGVIERLETCEYDLIHKVYVQETTLYDVAKEYGKSYQWATKIHRDALEHVQEMIERYGKTGS